MKCKLFSIKDRNILMNNIFKELLLESVSRNRIITSMKNRVVNLIYYDDPSAGDLVKSGYRSIEIYAYGLTKSGSPAIIAWLRNDFSKTLKSGRKNDAIRWRIFRLDRIKSFQNTNQKFDTSPEYVAANRPKLNLGYKTLPTIYFKIDPKEVIGK